MSPTLPLPVTAKHRVVKFDETSPRKASRWLLGKTSWTGR